MPTPLDQKLYDSIKRSIYKKYPTHSAHRSGLIVQEYKRRGGKYSGLKLGSGLYNWYKKEKWVDMDSYIKGKIRPCGSKSGLKQKSKLCRPLRHGSIKTASKFTKKQISKAKRIKSKGKSVNWHTL